MTAAVPLLTFTHFLLQGVDEVFAAEEDLGLVERPLRSVYLTNRTVDDEGGIRSVFNALVEEPDSSSNQVRIEESGDRLRSFLDLLPGLDPFCDKELHDPDPLGQVNHEEEELLPV